MALIPPDETSRFLTNDFYKLLLERLNYSRIGSMASWWTTSSSTTSTSTSSTYWGNTGYSYNYDTGESFSSSGISRSKSPSIKFKAKEPDYIPSDEGDGKRKLEKEFKFNPAFLELEGELLNVE